MIFEGADRMARASWFASCGWLGFSRLSLRHLVEREGADDLRAVEFDVEAPVVIDPGNADLLVGRTLAVPVAHLGDVGGQSAFAVVVLGFGLIVGRGHG